MNKCNKVKKVLKLIFCRCVMMPLFVVFAPFLFIMDDHECAKSKRDIMELLIDTWNAKI